MAATLIAERVGDDRPVPGREAGAEFLVACLQREVAAALPRASPPDPADRPIVAPRGCVRAGLPLAQ
jgi:hypothetical protein